MIEGRYLVIKKSESFWTGKAVKWVQHRDKRVHIVMLYLWDGQAFRIVKRKTFKSQLEAEAKYRQWKSWSLEF